MMIFCSLLVHTYTRGFLFMLTWSQKMPAKKAPAKSKTSPKKKDSNKKELCGVTTKLSYY